MYQQGPIIIGLRRMLRLVLLLPIQKQRFVALQ
jgi:hypothetical protein